MAAKIENRTELAKQYRDHLRIAIAEARRTNAANKFADGEAAERANHVASEVGDAADTMSVQAVALKSDVAGFLGDIRAA